MLTAWKLLVSSGGTLSAGSMSNDEDADVLEIPSSVGRTSSISLKSDPVEKII